MYDRCVHDEGIHNLAGRKRSVATVGNVSFAERHVRQVDASKRNVRDVLGWCGDPSVPQEILLKNIRRTRRLDATCLQRGNFGGGGRRDRPILAQKLPDWGPFWGWGHAPFRRPCASPFGQILDRAEIQVFSFAAPAPMRVKFGTSTFRFGCRAVRVRFGGDFTQLVVPAKITNRQPGIF